MPESKSVPDSASLKIFVVGDPCRGIGNPADDCGYMIDWLRAALGPAVRGASGTISALRGDTSGGVFPTQAFMAAAGLPPTRDGWATLQALDPLPVEACEIIDPLLDADATLVVGWGIPPWLLRRLLRRKTPIINLELDPVRFGRDIRITADVYGMRLADFLLSLAVDESLARIDAALFAAHHAMYPRLPWLKSGLRTAVFAGQTPVDLALVSDGKLVAPGDLVEDLRRASADHDLLLITPHPLATDWRLLDDLARHVPNACPAALPTHDVMLASSVDGVFAATSSVVDEAAQLGLDARHLRMPDVRAFGARHRTKQIVLDQRFFHGAVWQALAEGKKKAPQLPAADGLMRLRDSLGVTYANQCFPPPTISRERPLELARTSRDGLLPGLGWAPVEPWGRWSTGYLSTLIMLVDTAGWARPALEVVLEAAWMADRPELEVAVTRMGRDPLCVRWMPKDDGETRTLVLPLDVGLDSAAPIRAAFLRIDCSHIHHMPGYDDGRGLGIGVRSISLVEADNAE
jgi:hypothetical protein